MYAYGRVHMPRKPALHVPGDAIYTTFWGNVQHTVGNARFAVLEHAEFTGGKRTDRKLQGAQWWQGTMFTQRFC
jgi:hypothetical protein